MPCVTLGSLKLECIAAAKFIKVTFNVLMFTLFCTGRIWNHRRAGGLKRNFYMIDFNRLGGTICAPQEGVLTEKINKIINDPNRSARIALVASGEHKRYIIATENMQEGDAVKSTQIVSRSPSQFFSCFSL